TRKGPRHTSSTSSGSTWLSFVGSDNNEVILAFDSFALNLVHERNNEEPEEDNGIFKLVTLAR
ncbi:MAG: hypothetical protein ACI4TJ_07770, partial [Candidatus Cryptobacteroides sp.]